MANFYITINDDGNKQEVEASAVSTGVADTGKIVALNPEGLIDESMLEVSSYGSLITNVSGSYTLDMSLHNKWELILQADTRIYFDTSSMPADNTNADFTIVLRQDETGGRLPTFQYGSLWPNSVVPTFTSAPGARDVVLGFHLHTTAFWYLRVAGLNYGGALNAGVYLRATSTVSPTGSYVLSGAATLSSTATGNVFGGIIHTFNAALAAAADIAVAGTYTLEGFANPSADATVSAAGSAGLSGATDMTASAVIASLGGILVGGAVVMESTATHEGDAEVYLFVEGSAPMAADAVVAANSVLMHGGADAMAADATVSAIGTTPSPLTVSMTDSVNIGTDGVPNNGTFDDEGMTFSVTGGTGPYTYNIEVVQWREWDGSWNTGCAAQPNTNNTRINDTGFVSIGGCQWELSGQTALDLTSTFLAPNTPQNAYEFDCIITVTDSLSNEGSDTFLARYNLVY